MKYSQTTGECYADGLNYANLPADVQEITQAQWQTIYAAKLANMPAHVPVEEIPSSVTMYQARYVLIEDGRDDDVETAIENIEDPVQKKKARAAWLTASTVDRDSEFTQMLAAALELTESQLDSLFMRAGKVK